MRDRWFTDWEPSPRWPHYTRANAGEVLPTPASPLGQTFSWDRGIIPGARLGSCRTGLYEFSEYDSAHPEVFGFFGGYFFLNLANIRMQAVRNPAVTVEQLDLAFFGDHPDVPAYVPHPDDEKPHLLPAIEAHVGFVLSTTEWPELLEDRAALDAFRAERPDLATLSDADLLSRARRTQPMLVHGFSQHYVASSSSGIAPGILAAIGAAIGDPELPMRLAAGLGDVDSAEPSYALWDLSRQVRASDALTAAFDAGVEGLLGRVAASDDADVVAFRSAWSRFVREFGSRGPNEWEISAETWETSPEIALAALDRIRLQDDDESPRLRHEQVAASREAATEEARAKVADDPELAGQLDAALVGLNMMIFRERAKTTIIKAVHEGRMAFRELGHRHAAAGNLQHPFHIFMLTNEELESFVVDPSVFGDLLAERADGYRELFELEPPFIIADGDVRPLDEWERRSDASAAAAAAPGEVLQGVSGSPGKVTGRARIVTDPADPGQLQPGDILVAPLTDPAWTPLFMVADGVIVNVGGQISHAIIVSRELGVPCAVSVTDATTRIADGALVELDGDAGTVTVLEAPA